MSSTALEAAKRAGHVNIQSEARVEVMDLSAESMAEKAAYQAQMRAFEVKKHAKSIVVPTEIAEVKLRLRELANPITLFGEGPYDRRERLREVIAAIELRARGQGGEVGINNSSSDTIAIETKEDKERKDVFYSNAIPEMVIAREFLAEYSFRKSQERLSGRKRLYDTKVDGSLDQENADVISLYENTKGLELSSTAVTEQRPLVNLEYSPIEGVIATGSLGTSIKLWNSTNLTISANLIGHEERARGLSWHPDAFKNDGSAVLASASADGKCHLWDCRDSLNSSTAATLNPIQTFTGHNGALTNCQFHSSGRLVGTSGVDFTWRLWDTETGKELLLQDGHTKECTGIAFQCDGSLAMSCDAGGTTFLWDLRSGKRIHSFQGHVEKITACSFNPNGITAATASIDNMVRIWDIRSKKCSYMLPAHSQPISDAKYSNSGELLLTSSFDGSVKVWATRDNKLLKTLKGHSGKVMSADFSPDEKKIASAGFDRTIKLWAGSEF